MRFPDERRILMTPGPVVFSPDHLKYMLTTSLEHTSPDFAEIYSETLSNLRKILYCENSNCLPYIIPGTGTLAMEFALTNSIDRGAEILIVSHGYFGDRWIQIAKHHGYKAHILRSGEVGEPVDIEKIAEILDSGSYEAVLVSHVETSVGLRIDLERLAALLRSRDEILIVDGVSSVGAEELYMDRWGIDVVVSASQKALETPPGLAIVVFGTDKVSDRVKRNRYRGGYYIDIDNWSDVMESYIDRQVKYFSTPATHLIAALKYSLDSILSEGMENRFERHRIVAEAIRSGVRGMGLSTVVKNDQYASNTLTAVYLPNGIDPRELRAEMMRRNIVIANPIHPELKDKSIRIGHMGSVNFNDAVSTIASLERSLRKLGADIEIGSGIVEVQRILEKHMC